MGDVLKKADAVLALLDGMPLGEAEHALALASASLERCKRHALEGVSFSLSQWPARPDSCMAIESLYSFRDEATGLHVAATLPSTPDLQHKTGVPAEARSALKSSAEPQSGLGGLQ